MLFAFCKYFASFKYIFGFQSLKPTSLSSDRFALFKCCSKSNRYLKLKKIFLVHAN